MHNHHKFKISISLAIFTYSLIFTFLCMQYLLEINWHQYFLPKINVFIEILFFFCSNLRKTEKLKRNSQVLQIGLHQKQI